jgi:acyl-CoA thioesterase-1
VCGRLFFTAAITTATALVLSCARSRTAARDDDAEVATAAVSPIADDANVAPSAGADAAAPDGAAFPRSYKHVLLCGDSQVGYGHGLTRALSARFQDAGATKYYWDAFTSASVQSYDESDRLPKLVARLKPDVVFVSIGSNNVQNPHPEGLAGNVRSIAKKAKALGGDCFILGPPLPIKGVKKDTGIVRVLAENSAPCMFFDTSRLTLERQVDKIHPNDSGGEVWAEALWTFMLTGVEPSP